MCISKKNSKLQLFLQYNKIFNTILQICPYKMYTPHEIKFYKARFFVNDKLKL